MGSSAGMVDIMVPLTCLSQKHDPATSGDPRQRYVQMDTHMLYTVHLKYIGLGRELWEADTWADIPPSKGGL